MPKCFTEWTVLPHDPIEKLADNLWRVSGTMDNGRIQRQMVLARMKDGRVVVHNAMALEEPQMKEIEAWGEPAVLVVPNGFHRQDAAIWKKRYPKTRVFTPAAAKKRVAKIVAVDGTTQEAPADETVKLQALGGTPAESVLEVVSGGELTAVFTDAILNVPKRGGLVGLFLAPTGQVSVPRFSRMFFVKDKKAFRGDLEALAARSPRRLLFGHGAPVASDAAGALRGVIDQMS
jgi:hypothetical protein